MPTRIRRKREYLSMFSGPPSDRRMRKEALKYALDIRKFEIEEKWGQVSCTTTIFNSSPWIAGLQDLAPFAQLKKLNIEF